MVSEPCMFDIKHCLICIQGFLQGTQCAGITKPRRSIEARLPQLHDPGSTHQPGWAGIPNRCTGKLLRAIHTRRASNTNHHRHVQHSHKHTYPAPLWTARLFPCHSFSIPSFLCLWWLLKKSHNNFHAIPKGSSLHFSESCPHTYLCHGAEGSPKTALGAAGTQCYSGFPACPCVSVLLCVAADDTFITQTPTPAETSFFVSLHKTITGNQIHLWFLPGNTNKYL